MGSYCSPGTSATCRFRKRGHMWACRLSPRLAFSAVAKAIVAQLRLVCYRLTLPRAPKPSSSRRTRGEDGPHSGPYPRVRVYRCASVLAREEVTYVPCKGGGAEALELSVNIGGDPWFERRVMPVGPEAPLRR